MSSQIRRKKFLNSIPSNCFLVTALVTVAGYNINRLFSTIQRLTQELTYQQSATLINPPNVVPNAVDASTNELSTIYPNSVLPDKVFTIIGLEASGTSFLADTIRKALHLKQISARNSGEAFGEGYSNYYLGSKDPDTNYWTEVQHVSLPWGGLGCTQDPRQHIVPVLFPALCTKLMREREKMMKITGASNGAFVRKGPFVVHDVSEGVLQRYKIPSEFQETLLNECAFHVGKEWTYPNRYSLNLTSHLDWYHRHGVDAKAVVIMRDTTISRRARQFHCTNSTLFEMEEELGREILEQAIHKYIGPTEIGGDKRQRRRLVHTSSDAKVVLVSYELLLQLKDTYLDVLYNYLGINSTFNPVWKDGNAKYIINDEPKGMKR